MRVTFDIDGTICEGIQPGKWYDAVEPLPGAVEALKEMKKMGWYIILQTARHMKTCESNEGKVLAMGAPILFDWLKKWDVPYDEVYFGKPHAYVFVDDKGYHHNNWNETMQYLKNFAENNK